MSADHLATLWESIADAIGDETALVHGSQARSWAEFDDRAARLASALSKAGLGQGSVVAIDMYNCSEYLEVYFAALKIRAVPANVNYRYRARELAYLLDNSDAEALVFHAALADQVLSLGERLGRLKLVVQVGDSADSADSASEPLRGIADLESLIAGASRADRIERSTEDYVLSFTGGTTGLPKGVMMNLGRLAAGALLYRAMYVGAPIADGISVAGAARDLVARAAAPVAIPATPLMHSTGLLLTSIPTLTAGGTVVTLGSRSFDPDELMQQVARHRASVVGIAGDAFARPILRALDEQLRSERPYDATSLKIICSAGVAWSADTKDRLLAHLPGVTLYDTCGSTEGAQYGTRAFRSGQQTHSTNFDPPAGLLLLNEDGSKLDKLPGQVGLLASPTSAVGYYKDPARTAQVFRTIDGMPYVVPGDWGRLESDGTLTLLGRGTAVINTGGEKVYPEEVEDVLKSQPGVDDCLVFGMPDERFGQRVTAVVQLREGSTLGPPEIAAHARATLADYKVPRAVVVTASVPRLPNGKPDYVRARELASPAGGS